MKKRAVLSTLALAAAATASALTYNTNYVSGLREQFAITDDAQTFINVSSGVAFDPNSQTNGVYDKVYLVNKSASNSRRGLYLIDVVNKTYSGRLALAGDTSNDLDSPLAIAVNADGDAYVGYSGVPSVWKVEDPAGAAVESQFLGNYAGSGDDDPVCLAMVPAGFGGGFEEGVDVVVGDSGIGNNETEAISIVRTNGDVVTLWQDSGTVRGDASPVDGYVYSSRAPLERDYLGGIPRTFIRRVNSSGTSERVFLDIDVASAIQLDDCVKVNPVDGSVWIVIQDIRGANPDKRNVYRLDMVNAVATNGDYVVSPTLEIEDLGMNVGKNSMAFSPDGTQLVFATPDGQDQMKVYAISTTAPLATFQKQFFITDTNQTTISTSGGMVFNPNSQVGGIYDQVYLLNRSSNETNRGVYAVSIVDETTSSRLALGGSYGNTALNSPSDIAIDAAGTIYVSYSYAASVWKVTDVSGTPGEVQMLGNYGDTGADDDIESIAMMPAAFGGGFAADSDLLLLDGGFNLNGAHAVTALDAASTVGVPNYTVIWEGYHSDESLRCAASEYDGYIYFARWTVETADLGGTTRAYVNRLDSAGNVKRIFMDIDPSEVYKLDDAVQINPADGSFWLNIESPNSSTARQVVRVDVVNAVATNGDYFASAAVAIGESYNISANAIAFSPDGKLMAMPNSTGVDQMFVYDIVSTITPYQIWRDIYGLTGGDADAAADPDGDGLNNLYEYGLGGDPTNAADRGIAPTFAVAGGASPMTFVYPLRLESGLTYYLEINDDLIYGDWLNSGYSVVGTGSIDTEFDAVTNEIPTMVLDEQFIRLIIEE